MLLSISSFNQRPNRYWLVALVIATITASLLIASLERHWRSSGYKPAILDSYQLWSAQREQANADKALVFIGASRTQFGIDMQTVKAMLPSWQPVMLAVNGHYPLATLKDLAQDQSFKGTVIVDIDSRGMHLSNREAQQAYVSYYHNRWSPNWHIHRLLLTSWQQHMATARPALGAAPTLVRALDEAPAPHKFNFTLNPDRSGSIHFKGRNTETLAAFFNRGLQQDIERNPPPKPELWLKQLEELADWVAAIELRGGRVIFYEPPVSGGQRTIAAQAYPEAIYWDGVMTEFNFTSLSYRHEPTLTGFKQPDGSHIQAESKPAYTWALINALRNKQLL
jgi:hypothetical protein